MASELSDEQLRVFADDIASNQNARRDMATELITLRARCARLEAALKPQRRVRHKKRGTTYRVLGKALIQSGEPLLYLTSVVVYRGERDGALWVRRASEFEDGRFEDIQEPPQ